MKKRMMFIFTLMCFLFLVVGCAPSPEAPEAGTDVTDETPKVSKEEIVLRAVTFQPPNKVDDSMVVFNEYVDRVNKAGEGELRIDIVGGPEAIPMSDQLDAAMSGVVDIAVVWPVHMPIVPEGRILPLSLLTPWEEREVGFFDIYDEVNQELGLKVLGRMTTNSGFYIFSSKKIETMDDFVGLLGRSNVGLDPWIEGALGMTPVHIGLGDIYTSMDRGVIDATSFTIFGSDLGLDEVANYVLDEEVVEAQNIYAYMNLKTFNNLPEHLQDLLMEEVKQLEYDMVDIVEKLKNEEIQRLKDAGLEFVKFKSEEDRQEFFESSYEVRWEEAKKHILELGKSEEYYNNIRSIIYDDVR